MITLLNKIELFWPILTYSSLIRTFETMSSALSASISTDMGFIRAIAPEWIPIIENEQKKRVEEQNKLAEKLKNWCPLETQTVNVIIHGFALDAKGNLESFGTPCDECYFDAIKNIDGDEKQFCYNCRLDRSDWNHVHEPKSCEMNFSQWQKMTARKEYQDMSFGEVVESFRKRRAAFGSK